jgi:predicted metal-dependent peptidase
MEDLQIANKALDKAKISLMSKPDTSFFTTLCFSLRISFNSEIPTACVDGVSMLINPKFFMSLNPAEQVFLLVHEAMHVALLHIIRGKGLNHSRYNVAADHVINLMLIERGFSMPKMGLADPQYKSMSTEEVYKLLPENTPPPPMSDIGEAAPMEASEMQSHVEDMIVRASVQSQMDQDAAGTIPGDIQIFLNRLLKPKLPWNRILQKYVTTLSKSDYAFSKPNKRYMPEYFIPGLKSDKLMDIAVAVDVSGSVSQKDFDRMVSELHGIFRMMKPEKITLVHFDTEIKHVHPIRNLLDLKKSTFTGGGGTAIKPLTEWADENKPQLLLVFTDGYFGFHGAATKVNTIWLIHENPHFKPPFGKTIHYEI